MTIRNKDKDKIEESFLIVTASYVIYRLDIILSEQEYSSKYCLLYIAIENGGKTNKQTELNKINKTQGKSCVEENTDRTRNTTFHIATNSMHKSTIRGKDVLKLSAVSEDKRLCPECVNGDKFLYTTCEH